MLMHLVSALPVQVLLICLLARCWTILRAGPCLAHMCVQVLRGMDSVKSMHVTSVQVTVDPLAGTRLTPQHTGAWGQTTTPVC
jgi:hypothetical protein